MYSNTSTAKDTMAFYVASMEEASKEKRAKLPS
jgi:hypothetical protein